MASNPGAQARLQTLPVVIKNFYRLQEYKTKVRQYTEICWQTNMSSAIPVFCCEQFLKIATFLIFFACALKNKIREKNCRKYIKMMIEIKHVNKYKKYVALSRARASLHSHLPF
jgi:hypothetical protein